MTNRSHLSAAFVVALFSLTLANVPVCLAESHVVVSSSGSGRATGYAEANKIITHDGKTHVSWLDTDEKGFEVKIRTLDHAAGTWSPTFTIGKAQDNHGGPALAIDSQGYLHVVFYPHSRPMHYCRSTKPNDASAWTDVVEFGKNLTYPTLVITADDTLILTARNRGASKEPWRVDLYTKPKDKPWTGPTTIITADQASYSQFQEALAWGPDHKTLHLCTRMYGGLPTRWAYLVGYMKSTDDGRTWQRYDGTNIQLPATKETIDPVEITDPSLLSKHEDTSSLRASVLAVDSNNTPYMMYNTLSEGGAVPRQAWIARPGSNGGWDRISLNDKIDALPDGWGLGTPGGLVFTGNNRMSLLLTAADDVNDSGFWGTNSSEVIWAESSDGGQTFSSWMISKRNRDVANWLPNIEKPTGFNKVPANPHVLFLSGDVGSSNNDILQNNVVLWSRATLPKPVE